LIKDPKAGPSETSEAASWRLNTTLTMTNTEDVFLPLILERETVSNEASMHHKRSLMTNPVFMGAILASISRLRGVTMNTMRGGM
jgi:hypothetical protein